MGNDDGSTDDRPGKRHCADDRELSHEHAREDATHRAEGHGKPDDEGPGHVPSSQRTSNGATTGHQSGGSGMGAFSGLPRPPPLTIPTEGTIPLHQHQGISPLPGFLNSPYLDTSMAASPNLMALYNHLQHTSRGSGITPMGHLMSEGFTPAALLSPNLWPDSTRGGGVGALKGMGLGDLDQHGGHNGASHRHEDRDYRGSAERRGVKHEEGSEEEQAGSHWGSDRKQQQRWRSPGQDGYEASRPRRSSMAGSLSGGSMLPGVMPLASPSMAAVFKGVQYDKERGKWQVVVSDGQRLNVLGEYGNEMEALVANELLSPAAPLASLQAGGMHAFMASDPRGPSMQEVVARASTSALMQQAALMSPVMGALGGGFSPYGALSPVGLSTLLGGVPTPRVLHADKPKNYKGVRYHKERRQWQAYVLDDDQVHWLGFYDDEEAAAQAHDAEALRRFGPSADLNFNGDSPTEMVHQPSMFQQGSALLPTGREHVAAPWGERERRPPGRPPGGRGRGTPGRGRGRSRRTDHTSESSDDDYHLPVAVSQRGRARKPSAMAAAVAATVAEEAGGRGFDYHDAPSQRGRGKTASGSHHASPHHHAASMPSSSPPPPNMAFQGNMGGVVARVVSKFRGVTWDDEASKWQASAYENGSLVILGLFDSQEDAGRAYDAAIVRSGRKERLNFPPTHVRDPSAMPKHRSASSGHKITSQYKGVSWNSACSKWVAVLWDRELKRARHIGSFESEEDAARAYDREAIKMLGPDAGLNFRESMEDYLAASGGTFPSDNGQGHGSKGSSQYRGVSWHDRSQRWEVRVWGGGKQHFIGSFTAEVDAARAYDIAVLRLRGQDARSRSRMNFPVTEYNMDEINAEPLGSLAAAVEAVAVAGEAGYDEPTGSGGGGGQSRRSGRKVRRRRDSDIAGDSDLEELDEELAEGLPAGPPGHQGGLHGNTPQLAAGSAASGSGAMALAAALGATNGNSSMAVAAAALASLPAVTIYFDEGRKKWAAALVVAGNATVLGHCDNEGSARNMAHTSLVAALAPVMGQSAAAAMATAAMNKNLGPAGGGSSGPAGGSSGPRLSMDLGGPGPIPSALSAGASTGSGTALLQSVAASLLQQQQPHSRPSPNGNHGGSPRLKHEETSEDYHEDYNEDAEEELAGTRRQQRAAPMALAPSTIIPGGKPTMRGKSQYRGVSWCEKVKKWRALLWDGQKQRFLGHFTADTDAARAYDRALLDLKGSEAKTNFPASDYDGPGPAGDDLAAARRLAGRKTSWPGQSEDGVLNLALPPPSSGAANLGHDQGSGLPRGPLVMQAHYFTASMAGPSDQEMLAGKGRAVVLPDILQGSDTCRGDTFMKKCLKEVQQSQGIASLPPDVQQGQDQQPQQQRRQQQSPQLQQQAGEGQPGQQRQQREGCSAQPSPVEVPVQCGSSAESYSEEQHEEIGADLWGLHGGSQGEPAVAAAEAQSSCPELERNASSSLQQQPPGQGVEDAFQTLSLFKPCP